MVAVVVREQKLALGGGRIAAENFIKTAVNLLFTAAGVAADGAAIHH